MYPRFLTFYLSQTFFSCVQYLEYISFMLSRLKLYLFTLYL